MRIVRPWPALCGAVLPALIVLGSVSASSGRKTLPVPKHQEVPTPTPTVSALATPTEIPATPNLVAALETEQGKATERIALFDDGTLAYVTRWSGRSILTRKKLSTEEMTVFRQVCLEAAHSDEEGVRRGTVLVDANVRRIELELVDERGASHRFAFDDLTQLSLSLGRARGALEDLRSRFLVKDIPKDQQWDPKSLKEGDQLIRHPSATLKDGQKVVLATAPTESAKAAAIEASK